MATNGKVPEPPPDLLSAPAQTPQARVQVAGEKGLEVIKGVGEKPGLRSRASVAASGVKLSFIGRSTSGPKKRNSSDLNADQVSAADGGIATSAEVSRKHQVTYSQLSRGLKEVAGVPEQKKTSAKLASVVFPKLAVYNSTDPALGLPLVTILEKFGDPNVLRYAYYYLGRILSESGSSAAAPGGSVPTPNWDTLAVMGTDGTPSVTRADVIPVILARLKTEASTTEVQVHGRRLAALKAMVCVPPTSDEGFTALVHLIFSILDEVSKGVKKKRRRGGLFTRGTDSKEVAVRVSLHYAALSALRRLPMDPTSEQLTERASLGIGCGDPVGTRHALAMAAELALSSPAYVASMLERHAVGALAEAIMVEDVFARVYLAKLCGTLIHAPELYDRGDLRGLFTAILFQLLHDVSPRVVLEAILCIGGSTGPESSHDQRAYGWETITTAVVDSKPPGMGKDKSTARPAESVLKLVVRRLDEMLRSPSRPMLHGALRTVAELGKARAAAHALGIVTEDSLPIPEDAIALDFAQAMGKVAAPERPDTVDQLLGQLMAAVRMNLACECVYVRCQALKALLWMQSENESADELHAALGGELGDPEWPASLLNELLLTLHDRFRAAPGMAVTVLDLASLFVHKVPAKVDTSILQGLWKMCLMGCGLEGKHLALDAVSNLMDLPPPPPPPRGATQLEKASASDPRSALAMQRIVQAAIWFLGENANYAAAEYAWESSTPPSAALMMLGTDRMLAAAAIRNPTLGAALARLQRCALVGSWEERVVAANALITVAIRSGEPYRLQIYEFFHSLVYGGLSAKDLGRGTGSSASNGENRGASGTGLASVIGPMLRALDEMYQAQDQMMKDIRQHEFNKEPWSDEDLERLYLSHLQAMDMALLFCFVPRSKYLPLGPVSGPLVRAYQDKHNISSNAPPDPAIQEGVEKLLNYTAGRRVAAEEFPVTLLELTPDLPPESMRQAGGEGAENAEEFGQVALNFDNLWAASLLEQNDDESNLSSGSNSPTSSLGSGAFNVKSWDEESIAGIASARVGGKEGEQQESSDRDDVAGGSEPQGVIGSGRALYAFAASDDEELNLAAGDEFDIEYEADGWYHVRKKEAGPDGKLAGFVPVLYVEANF